MSSQRGMALLASLVFMMLLSMIGLASMASAARQEKMAAVIHHGHHSFQAAEAALRSGESWLESKWRAVSACISPASCSPPIEARTQAESAIDPVSGVHWVSVEDGLYGIQNLGPGITPAHLPATTVTHLYRVTGIGWRGQSRTVLESIYTRYQGADDGTEGGTPQVFQRGMWRQLQ